MSVGRSAWRSLFITFTLCVGLSPAVTSHLGSYGVPNGDSADPEFSYPDIGATPARGKVLLKLEDGIANMSLESQRSFTQSSQVE